MTSNSPELQAKLRELETELEVCFELKVPYQWFMACVCCRGEWNQTQVFFSLLYGDVWKGLHANLLFVGRRHYAEGVRFHS